MNEETRIRHARPDELQEIMEIYADVESKCQRAKDMSIRRQPIDIEGMLIEKAGKAIR